MFILITVVICPLYIKWLHKFYGNDNNSIIKDLKSFVAHMCPKCLLIFYSNNNNLYIIQTIHVIKCNISLLQCCEKLLILSLTSRKSLKWKMFVYQRNSMKRRKMKKILEMNFWSIECWWTVENSAATIHAKNWIENEENEKLLYYLYYL